MTNSSRNGFAPGAVVQPWQPGNFDRRGGLAAAAVPTPPPADTIVLPTAEEIEAMQEQARQEGYDAGYREGLERGGAESAALLAFSDAFHGEISRLDEAVAAEVATLALAIAQRVIGVAHQHDRTLIARVVEHALQALPANFDPARILVHPADLAVVQAHLGEEFAGRRISLAANAAVSRGGCRVQTSTTDIDGTLESRWQRVTEVLGAAPWSEPTLPDTPAPPEDGEALP